MMRVSVQVFLCLPRLAFAVCKAAGFAESLCCGGAGVVAAVGAVVITPGGGSTNFGVSVVTVAADLIAVGWAGVALVWAVLMSAGLARVATWSSSDANDRLRDRPASALAEIRNIALTCTSLHV
jgi:hypothetical protein